MGVWSQLGRRVISFCFPTGPTIAVRISGTSSSETGDVKSCNEGPAFKRSLNIVGERREVDDGGAVGSVGSETAVAKLREACNEGRTLGIGGTYKHRSRATLEAIAKRIEKRKTVG